MTAEILQTAATAVHCRDVVSLRVAGLFGDDESCALRLEGQHTQRSALPCLCNAGSDQRAADGQGNDLHRGDDGAAPDRRKRWQGGHRDRLVDPVDAVDDVGLNRHQAAHCREKIAAAGMRRAYPDLRSAQGVGNGTGSGVFIDIAGFQSGAMHPRDARRREHRKVGAGETATFLQYAIRQTQAVGQQQPVALRQGKFAENHVRSPR